MEKTWSMAAGAKLMTWQDSCCSPPIGDTGSENSGDGRQIQACQYKNNDTDDQSNDNKLGHAFFGCFVLPFPHIAADDGIASGSKHGSDSKDDINDRVDNI